MDGQGYCGRHLCRRLARICDSFIFALQVLREKQPGYFARMAVHVCQLACLAQQAGVRRLRKLGSHAVGATFSALLQQVSLKTIDQGIVVGQVFLHDFSAIFFLLFALQLQLLLLQRFQLFSL